MSVMIQIARDVAAKVSTVQIAGRRLAAALDVAPDFDLAQVKQRKIIVTPQSYSRNNATRGDSGASAKVNVCLIEKIAIAEAESRVSIMETVASALERQPLTDGGAPYALVTAVEFDPVYDAQLLRNSRVFLSICTVTVKVIR